MTARGTALRSRAISRLDSVTSQRRLLTGECPRTCKDSAIRSCRSRDARSRIPPPRGSPKSPQGRRASTDKPPSKRARAGQTRLGRHRRRYEGREVCSVHQGETTDLLHRLHQVQTEHGHPNFCMFRPIPKRRPPFPKTIAAGEDMPHMRRIDEPARQMSNELRRPLVLRSASVLPSRHQTVPVSFSRTNRGEQTHDVRDAFVDPLENEVSCDTRSRVDLSCCCRPSSWRCRLGFAEI